MTKPSVPQTEEVQERVARLWGWLRRALSCLATGVAVIIAGALAILMWDAYMGTPWTRDGAVRAYVIDEKPEVSGRIVNLPIIADQFVHRGDLLMVIEPDDYEIAVQDAEAAVTQAMANWDNKRVEAARRQHLTTLSTSVEEQQTFASEAAVAEALYHQAEAKLARTRLNLQRTRLVSPVSGYVTNLNTQVGDYATAGESVVAIVDADSFWVDGYFEETLVDRIRPGAAARIKLMGSGIILRGHVTSLARGISVPNALSDPQGLAAVNPIFTWIRLAQRLPVRVAIDDMPKGVTLAIGRTATVEVVESANQVGPTGLFDWLLSGLREPAS